ncbi:MAG: GDP-mannose 4,6-dehydratase [Acidimicrobiia bacterium]
MQAVITGARGFVGPHLATHLEECGDTVVPLDRRGPVPFDVTEPESVHHALARSRPDAVYHLAALSHVGDSWNAPAPAFRVNAEGTLNVLRACVDLGIDRVIVVGSAEEYGRVDPADLPLSEDAPLRPVTPYGASKVAGDFLALQAFLGDGLGAIRARPFNHSGPGQEPKFLVPALASRIARAEHEGAKEIPVGSLDAIRDLTDVRDVVRAYRLLVEHGEPGEVYNICSGRGVAVSEIAAGLLERARHEIRLVVDPELVRPVEVPRLVGDNRRLRAATGWQPEYELATTLADVLDNARRDLT